MTTNSFDWNELQLNPDNWIDIPEFGVMPADVDFQGFAFPILDPTTDGDHWRAALFEASSMVRQQARTRFASLADIKDLYYKAFDSAELKAAWTDEHVFAIRYGMFFDYVRRSIDDFEDDKEGCLNSVSLAMQLALKMQQNRVVDLAEVRSELSRIGNAARHDKNKQLSAWAVDQYRAGNYNSPHEASHDLKDATIQKAKELGARLSPTRAQKTIYEWLLKADKG